jgi:hypothetical protein
LVSGFQSSTYQVYRRVQDTEGYCDIRWACGGGSYVPYSGAGLVILEFDGFYRYFFADTHGDSFLVREGGVA